MGYEIKKELIDKKEQSGEVNVSVPLGELRDVAEIIRGQALELEKEITKARDLVSKQGGHLDTLGLNQTKLRLATLYKQLTGLEPQEGLWSLK